MIGLLVAVVVTLAAVVGLIAWAAVSINRDDEAEAWDRFDREIERVLTKSHGES